MKHCLVVDDSKVIRQVARHLLQTLDFDVTEASNGKEALEEIGAHIPDAVLLDWNMPVMDGMEFLSALGELNLADRPKTIFCTSENGVSRVRDAIAAGADEYLMKPFDRETLQEKLVAVGLI
ncbi:MAG: response regulator [Sphingomonadaceae bacterium]|nr:response regulator [Sphingomonadaceae bacterium]